MSTIHDQYTMIRTTITPFNRVSCPCGPPMCSTVDQCVVGLPGPFSAAEAHTYSTFQVLYWHSANSFWSRITSQLAGPEGSFVLTGACNLEVPGSNPGQSGYLSSCLCICSAPNCSKAWSVQCCL